MKRIGLFLVLLITIGCLYGQGVGRLKGVVKDAKTGEKLVGVNVFIENSPIGTSTNIKGEFDLTNVPLGKQKLTASLVGYKQDVKMLLIKDGIQKVDFALEEASQSLSEIIVTAKSEARKLREKAAPISVISMSQLQGTVNSISDVLNKTVGVTIRNAGGVGSASRISVRGLEGKRIGFLLMKHR